MFDEVIVSSEDPEILKIAKKYGAQCHVRPDSIATDTSSVVEVCLDVLRKKDCDAFCCVYPTAVLLSSETIRSAINTFNTYDESQCSVLMGVSEYNYPPVQALVENSDGHWKMMFEKYLGLQSQKYPICKVSNGTLYLARKNVFLEKKSFYSQNLKVFDVHVDEVNDIDNLADYLRLKKFE